MTDLDPGEQHLLDGMAAATAIIKEIAGFLDPDNAPVDAADCALYRSRLNLAKRILDAAHSRLTPHRASIAVLIDHGDPLDRLATALDARIARMAEYLGGADLDAARQAEVKAKMNECEVMRRWIRQLQSPY